MDYNYINGAKVGVYTYYTPNIPPSFVEYQKKVFDCFDVTINQMCYPLGVTTHGKWLTDISKTEEVDYLVFFDIDAIPLKRDFLSILINRVFGKKAILGIEVKNNYPDPTSKVFAGAPCYVMPKYVYKELGEPSYEIVCKDGRMGATYFENTKYDTSQWISVLAEEKGVEVQLLRYTGSLFTTPKVVPSFSKVYFCSIYEDLIYHNWEGRGGSYLFWFISQCNKVLNENSGAINVL